MGRRLSTAVADNAKLQRASLDHLGMAHAARQLERDALGAAQGQPRQYKLLVAQRVLEIEKLNGKRVWIVWPPRQRASPAAGAKAPSGDNDSPPNDGTGVAGASASDGARESAPGPRRRRHRQRVRSPAGGLRRGAQILSLEENF